MIDPYNHLFSITVQRRPQAGSFALDLPALISIEVAQGLMVGEQCAADDTLSALVQECPFARPVE